MPVAPLGSLFTHYFDNHYVLAATGSLNHAQVRVEADLATRMAVLAADTVYVPAASYVENPLCRDVVGRLEPLFVDGGVRLIAGDAHMVDFAAAKLLQYDPGGQQHRAYRDMIGATASPPWFARRRSATADIRRAWLAADLGVLASGQSLPTGLDRAWAAVPDLLAEQPGTAFTPEYARPLLTRGRDLDGPGGLLLRRAGDLINDAYANSFAGELGAGMVVDLVYLAGSGNGNPAAVNLSYGRFRSRLRDAGALDRVVRADPERLVALRQDPAVAGALLGALSGTPPALDQHRLALRVTDTTPLLNAIRATRTGRRQATAYHRRVRDLLEAIFPFSLGPAVNEVEIDEGRKRVDIWQPNVASGGLLGWVRQSFGCTVVLTEVKNYVDDIGNPEIDQLAGRFSPWHGRFGLMVCRSVKDRGKVLARCRDVLHKQNALIVVLADDDLEALAAHPVDPGLSHPFEGPLGERVAAVYT